MTIVHVCGEQVVTMCLDCVSVYYFKVQGFALSYPNEE